MQQEESKKIEGDIEKVFTAGKTELKEEDFESACVDLWKVPKIL
jgi:hypothetical protein